LLTQLKWFEDFAETIVRLTDYIFDFDGEKYQNHFLFSFLSFGEFQIAPDTHKLKSKINSKKLFFIITEINIHRCVYNRSENLNNDTNNWFLELDSFD